MYRNDEAVRENSRFTLSDGEEDELKKRGVTLGEIISSSDQVIVPEISDNNLADNEASPETSIPRKVLKEGDRTTQVTSVAQMDNNIREDQQFQDDESQKSRFAEKRAPKRSTEEQDQKLAASSFDQDKIEVAPTPKAELPQALEVSLAHDYNTLDVDANHDLSLSPRNEPVESEATWNRVMLKNKGREKLIKAPNDYSPSSVRQKLNHVRVKSTKANSPTRLSARAMESAQRVYKNRGARNNS